MPVVAGFRSLWGVGDLCDDGSESLYQKMCPNGSRMPRCPRTCDSVQTAGVSDDLAALLSQLRTAVLPATPIGGDLTTAGDGFKYLTYAIAGLALVLVFTRGRK